MNEEDYGHSWSDAGVMFKAGLREVETCTGTGVNPCIFNYQHKSGKCLRIITLGEYNAGHYEPTVDSWSFECPPLEALKQHVAIASDAIAVSALRKAQPAVRWDKESVIAADIDCDGKLDRIALGYGKVKSVWVGLIPSGARPITMRFAVGQHSQDSFCSIPVRLETNPLTCSDEEMGDLPGCKEAKGCTAFSVIDDSCDSFHFYWNVSRKEPVWWRR